MSNPFPPLLWLPLCIWALLLPAVGCCDGTTTALRTELEDLQTWNSRILIDFREGPFARYRLMYLENRSSCDPALQPERWALGISGPLINAGPVSLEGALAQLYNPLAHGPGSEVRSAAAGLALDIDLQAGSRRGLHLAVVPEYLNCFALYQESVGLQLGSTLRIPCGSRGRCELVGMLANPPDQLGDDPDGAWYVDAAFPGGLLTQLCASLTYDPAPLHLQLLAAASGGRRVAPGTLGVLHLSWAEARTGLHLLLGHCSPVFTTPEGQSGDLEWLAAARVEGELGPLLLEGSYSKEISPLPLLPVVARESRDRLSAAALFCRRVDPGCLLSVEGQAALQLRWGNDGSRREELRLEAGGGVEWRLGLLEVKWRDVWCPGAERLRDLQLVTAYHPRWGKIQLATGYRSGTEAGLRAAAAVEAHREESRIYLRLESRDVLSPGMDFFQLFSLSMGWEVKTRKPAPR